MAPLKQFRVEADGLNLRSEPKLQRDLVRAVLPHGHVVEKLAEAAAPAWWQVQTTFRGAALEGFVASRFLTPAEDFEEPAAVQGLPAVHMKEGRPEIARASKHGLAYPLGEPGRPGRGGATEQERAAQLTDLVEWLDVEDSERYQPESSPRRTFCNIYAYDYCYLAGVYLPRVWWTPKAVERLGRGEAVVPKYGETIEEQSANSLFRWLVEYAPVFGWVSVFDRDELQAAANRGEVVLICAQNKHLDHSGHICPVVPETELQQAVREGGVVTGPLQGQAGGTNFSYGTKVWWTGSQFRQFGFWRHV